jgi:hypothetical protein
MKRFFLLIGLLTVVSCQTTKVSLPTYVSQPKPVQDTTYISEQKALAIWLMSQPQQVRDDFKRDFTFSGKQIKEFVDTLKKP